jgi:hypothetical protein
MIIIWGIKQSKRTMAIINRDQLFKSSIRPQKIEQDKPRQEQREYQM